MKDQGIEKTPLGRHQLLQVHQPRMPVEQTILFLIRSRTVQEKIWHRRMGTNRSIPIQTKLQQPANQVDLG